MKSWLFFTICLIMTSFIIFNNALEVPEHMRKMAKQLHKRCQNQSDTPEDIIRESLSGLLPKNKNFECYVQCLFDIIGIMDENNVIRIDNLLQILPEEMHSTIVKLAELCGTKEGEEKCNIAYNTLQCYLDNIVVKDNFQFLFD